VKVDLSATGIDATALRTLAQALEPQGVLAHVSSLAVGKNCLGREPGIAADAVARLLVRSSALESLDISLNMLPSQFLHLLAESVERLAQALGQLCPARSSGKVRHVDMHLNNRRAPTALLERTHDRQDPCAALQRLVTAVPTLREIDIRACGANEGTRRELFMLCRHMKEQRGDNWDDAIGDDYPRVLVVSSGIYDECR
jgi:hypothetical protein